MPNAPSAPAPSPSEPAIQTKAIVIDLGDSSASASVGIMAAYEPKSRSFWWRSTPMISEGSMLQRFYERCKFFVDGRRLMNICVNGPQLVTSSTAEFADSMEAGLEKVQQLVRENGPVQYEGPRDAVLPLKEMGQDMTTAEGQAAAVVESVKRDDFGYEVAVSCSCGDRTFYLNKYFMSYKVVSK